jgi:hypothetical protein
VTAIPLQEMGDTRPDAHLLNGPSLNGVSQDDVDALMANLASAAPAAPQAAAEPAAVEPPPAPAPKAKAASAPAPAPLAGAAPAKAKPAAPAGERNGVTVNGAAFNQNEVDALFD